MTEKAGRLDWVGAKSRLEKVRAALDQGFSPSAEDLEAVYRQRAERLGQNAAEAASVTAENMIIVFQVGDFRYGLLASDVQEVLPHAQIAPVPGAPAAVLGVIQVRGEIRPVYNLLTQLRGEAAPPPEGPMILLTADQVEVAIKVTSVEDIRPVELDRPNRATDGSPVAWTTEDFVTVLDPRRYGEEIIDC